MIRMAKIKMIALYCYVCGDIFTLFILPAACKHVKFDKMFIDYFAWGWLIFCNKGSALLNFTPDLLIDQNLMFLDS